MVYREKPELCLEVYKDDRFRGIACPSTKMGNEEYGMVTDAFGGNFNDEAWYSCRQTDEPSWCLRRLDEKEIKLAAMRAGMKTEDIDKIRVAEVADWVADAVSLNIDEWVAGWIREALGI